ncbi:partitioning defective protein 6-like [Rhopilema esculentum]|uniref:partitioning defective protein 6-like n=1 Tax=Rhopilema esculentum TaxID=499914 RepID=UPI0031CE4E48
MTVKNMSNRKKTFTQSDLSVIEVKSKFEAEFRRFAIKRGKISTYGDFFDLVQTVHRLYEVPFTIWYKEPLHGDVLPINNNENCLHALNTAQPMLRLFLQRAGDAEGFINGTLPRESKRKSVFSTFGVGTLTNAVAPPVNMAKLAIGVPQDFRRVSAIIDVDILPETVRRVRLCKHNSDKPLGFYIRDGTSIRVTSSGIEKVPGIFISRLIPGGLADSTGLLSVNDEVLEVNGIEVTNKSLDQVTDMMVANSHNLIITVKPVNEIPTKSSSLKSQPNNGVSRRVTTTNSMPPNMKPSSNGKYAPPSRQSGFVEHTSEPLPDSDDEEHPVISDGVVHV